MAKASLKRVEEAPQQEHFQEDELVLANHEPDMSGTGSVDDLDAMFDSLEAGLTTGKTVEVIVGDGESHNEQEMIAAGRALNTEELKAAAMIELDNSGSPAPDDSKTPAPVQGKKPAPITKRISTMGMSKSVALATALGDQLDTLLTIETTDSLLGDEEAFNKRFALLETIDKLPIKIGEKVTNLYAHLGKGATLSLYTRKAIDHLVAAGEMTSKSLRDVYMVRYSEGTASSQATQMMKLLPTLGLAIRDGQRLLPNPNSTLLPLLTVKAESEVE